MSPRLLVTGAGGFVGGNILFQAFRRLDETWHIHALSRRPIDLRHSRFSSHTLDPLDREQLQGAMEVINPQVVIHAAAIADIDFCQANPQVATRVNVDLTMNLAELCLARRARMVFVSTDTVFDGGRGDYVEEDERRPVNVYGETKVAAESMIRLLGGNWIIARTALVMGFPAPGAAHDGNTFLPKMLAELRKGNSYGAPDEEIRTPIDVITLSRALLELATSGLSGCFHLAGNDLLNRFEMARRIARRFGFSKDSIVVRNASSTPGRAPRPRNVSLNNSKARATLKTPMLGLDAALDLILENSPQPDEPKISAL